MRRVLVDHEEPFRTGREDEGLAVLPDRDDVRDFLLGGRGERGASAGTAGGAGTPTGNAGGAANGSR